MSLLQQPPSLPREEQITVHSSIHITTRRNDESPVGLRLSGDLSATVSVLPTLISDIDVDRDPSKDSRYEEQCCNRLELPHPQSYKTYFLGKVTAYI
jgi:hypothetical protein